MSGRYSRSQASTTDAKASLISTRSMSSSDSFALASTSSVAGMGAVSMIWGSLAATAKVWKRARGAGPSDDARSSLMISTAAAPSEICDDVPAVTVPVSEKAGFSPASFSSEVSRRTPSSASSSPLTSAAPGTSGCTRASSGTISLAKRPSSVARAARWCERSANSSISSRRDLPAPGDLLGALALVDQLEALRVERPVGLARPGLGRRPDRHPAHRLHAGADGHVHGARHDGLGGEVDGLLGRAALAVDRRAGHRLGEPRRQRGVAGDVHRLLARPSWCTP